MNRDTVLKWFGVWVAFVLVLIVVMMCGGAGLIVKLLG